MAISDERCRRKVTKRTFPFIIRGCLVVGKGRERDGGGDGFVYSTRMY